MTFKEYKKTILASDPELKAEYDALKPQYELIRQIIAIRIEKNMSQTELARLAGTKQSNISRFESGNYNPSLEFVNKLAKALGMGLSITIR